MCRISLVLFLCLLLPSDRLHAFSEADHHVDAAMAFGSLDAEMSTQMRSILQQHPRFIADFDRESEFGHIDVLEEYLKRAGQVGQIRASQVTVRLAQSLEEPAPATSVGNFRPAIDGEFHDWADVGESAVHVEDGVGDAEGEFDVDRLTAIMVGNQLFVRF